MAFKNNQEDSDDEDNDSLELIRVIDNNIYFYDEVNNSNALKINIHIRNLIKKHTILSIQTNSDFIPINLYINSQGGEISAAFCIIDTILTSKVPIYTIIEGEAASAATLISVVGHKRFIQKHAHMLIHQMRCGFWGKMDECTDEMKNIKKYTKTLKNIYKKYTTISDEKLDLFLKKDIYWSSKLCLKYGLIDEIIE